MKVRFLLPARQELRDAVLAYNRERAGLGDEFRDAVWEAIQRVVDFPDAWHRLSSSIRRCRMRRFPYAVIYQSLHDEIVVIAVAHLHREPTYWQKRSS
ncbi:MAG: type II toxin-antitoxin system RelE/ParE family toxin [Rhodanobacteraceae bacterium]|nr:type II toxin-antitoxin system RelE/ParE family toxin [Rhodanobacteraceae bacterium]